MKVWLLTVVFTGVYDSDPKDVGVFSTPDQAKAYAWVLTPEVQWYKYKDSYSGSLNVRYVGISGWIVQGFVLDSVDEIDTRNLQMAAERLD